MATSPATSARLANPSSALRWWVSLACGIVALLIFIERFHFWDAPLNSPWGFQADGLIVPGNVKAIMEEGWFLNIRAWGAPETFHGHDFPLTTDGFHCLVFKILGWLTQDVNVTINVYFLARVVLTAFGMCWILMRWGAGAILGAMGGVLYALAPTHTARGLGHNFLGIYYILPWVLSLWLSEVVSPSARPSPFSGVFARWAAVIVPSFIVGGSGAYYSAFYLMLCCFGIVVHGAQAGWTPSLWWHRSRALIVSLLITGITTVGWNIPLILFKRQMGANPDVAMRYPFESEIYSLKISYLFGPAVGNPIKAWWETYLAYNKYAPLTSENVMGTLGLIGGIGFVLAFIFLIRWSRRPDPPVEQEPLLWTARAILFIIVLSTIGGIGTFVAYLLFPGIRAYNRSSVILSFFSLFFFCLSVEPYRKRLPKFFAIFLFTLGALGTSDLTGPRRPGPSVYIEDEKKYLRFMEKFENLFTENTMVLMLPYHRYPEAGEVTEEVLDYFQLKFYLTAKKRYHWSYPNMTGRPADRWLTAQFQDSPTEWLYRMQARGFGAIILQRNAFREPTKELETEISAILGPPLFEAPEIHTVVWRLAPKVRIKWDQQFVVPQRVEWDPGVDIQKAILSTPLPRALRQNRLAQAADQANQLHQSELALSVTHPAVDEPNLRALTRVDALPFEGLRNKLTCPKAIRLRSEGPTPIELKIENTSAYWWAARSANPSGLYKINVRSSLLRDLESNQDVAVGVIFPISRPIAPGEVRRLVTTIPPLSPEHRRLSLVIGLVQENSAWASQFGNQDCKVMLTR